MLRSVLLILFCASVCALVVAQQPTTAPQQAGGQQPENSDDFRIPVSVDVVVVPTMVLDHDGYIVNGLRKDQFHLYDNTKEQDVQVDSSFYPISLVLAIQANSHVEGLLPQVRKIGNLIKPLIVGDQGEVALIAYDGRVRVLQEFTSDADKITDKVKTIFPGSDQNRMIDAVMEGTRMLQKRERNRRRIMLTIGETRDLGSAGRAREALIGLQLSNIVFYSVDMSRFITTLTAPPPVPRPDTLPPAMHQVPGITPSTPTTVAQTYGYYPSGRIEFIPLMLELYKDAKAIFKSNPVEMFTKGTGGTEFGFHTQRTLETAVEKVGEELHSQYLLTYSPNNKDEGGFHEIKIGVVGHPDYKVYARPGYWLPPKGKG
jgi:VWFA-related protein